MRVRGRRPLLQNGRGKGVLLDALKRPQIIPVASLLIALYVFATSSINKPAPLYESSSWLKLNSEGIVEIDGFKLPSFTEEVLGGLPDNEPFTFFAPKDRDIELLQRRLQAKVGEEAAQELLSDVLLHHLVPIKRVFVKDLPAHGSPVRVKAVSGQSLVLTRDKKTSLRVDNIKARQVDLRLGKGVVHLIERPLMTKAVQNALAGPRERNAADEADETEVARENDDGEVVETGSDEGTEDAERREESKAQQAPEAEAEAEADATVAGDASAATEQEPRVTARPQGHHRESRQHSEKVRLQEQAAEELARQSQKAEEEAAKKALAGLNQMLLLNRAERGEASVDSEVGGEGREGTEGARTAVDGVDNVFVEGETGPADESDVVAGGSEEVELEKDTQGESAEQQEESYDAAAESDGKAGGANSMYSDVAESMREQRNQVVGSPHFKAFNGSLLFSRVRLSQEALALADKDAVTVAINTPRETLPIIEDLTAQTFKSLWADLPEKPLLGNKVYESCALVGNSGVLLRRARGEEIDAHTMVLRLDRAPTVGYERFVGRKTTLRMMPVESAGFKEDEEGVLYALHTPQALQELLAYKKQFFDEQIHFLSPEFLTYASSSAGNLPSLEYTAINLAVQMCTKVSLYGYFAAERQGARYHYYDMEKATGNPVSPSEFAQARALEASGVLSTTDPCVAECHQSLAACSSCLKVSVPDLFSMNELDAEQKAANKDRDARWEAFQELRKKYAAHRAAEAERLAHPGHFRKSRREQEREKERERTKHQITYDNKVEADLQSGWEYLIASNQLPDMSEGQLREYFVSFNIATVPSTKLEMIMEIRNHHQRMMGAAGVVREESFHP